MSIGGDRPIKHRSQDRFHRGRFASLIARQILSLPKNESFVLGLTGPWGSGKTSIIAMIQEELAGKPEVSVLHFNPWLFSGAHDLVADFFREIAAQIDESVKSTDATQKSATRLGEKLSLFAKYVSPIGKLAAVVGKAAVGGVVADIVGAVVENAGEIVGAEGDRHKQKGAAAPTPSLKRQREEIEKDLNALNRKLLVVIDDLDRLHEGDIREIMKLVRLTADFPNMIYLLAFDRRRVEDALGEEKGYGQVYVEKIFQAVHEVPAISRTDLNEYLTSEVNALIANQKHIESSESHLKDMFWKGILPLFGQPREVARYVNAVRFALECLGDEITVADIFGMEALRIMAPALFKELPSLPHLFVADALAWYRRDSRDRGETEKKAFDALMSRIDDGRREALQEVISHLFPVARRFINREGYDETAPRRWRRARRVANAELFRLYFEATLPQGVLPTITVQAAADALGDEERLSKLLAELDPSQLRHLLDRLEDYQWEYPVDVVEPALVALANQTHRVQPTSEDSFGKSMGVGRVLLRLLRRIESQDERDKVVRRAFPRLKRLATQLHLVRLVGRRKGTGHSLVSEAVEADLAAQVRARVLVVTAEELAVEDDLADLLYFASEHDPKALDHVRRLAENLDVFARILESCISAAHAGALGSVVVREEKHLPWQALETLLEKDRLTRLVRDSAPRANDGTLSNAAREAIGVALKYVEGWRPSIGWGKESDDDDDAPAVREPASATGVEGKPAGETSEETNGSAE